MSQERRKRRQQQRSASFHMGVLGELLGRFYTLLERTPKPSDEEIRQAFKQADKAWRTHCHAHHLTTQASSLFNQEVAVSWRNRYTQP